MTSARGTRGFLGSTRSFQAQTKPLSLPLFTDGEGEAIAGLFGVREGEGDAADVVLGGHGVLG